MQLYWNNLQLLFQYHRIFNKSSINIISILSAEQHMLCASKQLLLQSAVFLLLTCLSRSQQTSVTCPSESIENGNCKICYRSIFNSTISIDSCYRNYGFYNFYQEISSDLCNNICCKGKSLSQNWTLTILKQCDIQSSPTMSFHDQSPFNYALLILIIPVGVSVGVALLIRIFVAYCRTNNNQTNQNNRFFNNYFPSNPGSQLIWLPFRPEQQIDISSNCTICLDDITNSATACGHKFHLKCLKDWLTRNQKCPNCNANQFNPVKLICQICRLMQAQIYLKQDTNIQPFVNMNLIVCSLCRNQRPVLQSRQDLHNHYVI